MGSNVEILVLVLHCLTTWAMTGLIWVIQIVHYPLFLQIGDASFVSYQLAHQRRITWVVVPLMLVELVTGMLLISVQWGALFWQLNALGIALVWISTFLIQVPLHRRLLGGADTRTCRLLVAKNWIRTLLWTCRAIGLAVFIYFAAVQGLSECQPV